MESILLHNPSGPDLEFEGELLLRETFHDLGGVSVYRTRGGRYVLRQTRSRTGVIQRVDRLEHFASLDELNAALGHSEGAKRVMSILGHTKHRNVLE